MWGSALARRRLVFHGEVQRWAAGSAVWLSLLQAVQGPSGALEAPRCFPWGPAGGRLSPALNPLDHDLLEQGDRWCLDWPAKAQLAKVRSYVARERFAGLKELAAEIAEDRGRRPRVCRLDTGMENRRRTFQMHLCESYTHHVYSLSPVW